MTQGSEPLLESHGHGHGGSTGASHPGHGVGVELGFVAHDGMAPPQLSLLAEGAGVGKVLFLQLPSGIAGDMTISALLDLGVPLSVVQDAVDALGLDGVELVVRRGYVGAIGCTHFHVHFSPSAHERSYLDIVALIGASQLKPSVKKRALSALQRLGEAEAAVHATTLEHVHFHEVGAVDSIVDLIGAAAALDYLGARVFASPVPVGSGFVECRHGVLPLPAPATVYCLQGVPTVDSGLETELVTPTGAAILSTVSEKFVRWVPMRPIRIGWGAGTKGLSDRPNVLRAILGDPVEAPTQATHVLLEANLDDMTGEGAGHALSAVLRAGALDCWLAPVTMKKGRPGLVFSAISTIDDAHLIADSILRETTSIGVRHTLISRTELPREVREISTPLGLVRVKLSRLQSGRIKFKVELDDCVAIAERTKLSLSEVLDQVNHAASSHLE